MLIKKGVQLMKIYKKIIFIGFSILCCLLPNTIKADDEDIMLTEAAYICTKCGGTFVNIQKIYTSDWEVKRSFKCPDYANGYDHVYHKYFYYTGSCNNCGNKLYHTNHFDEKIICQGYN